MRKHKLSALTAFLFAAFLITGCGKYEDGPSFSLATKKNRVANTWKVEKVFINDVDRTSLFQVWINTYKIELTSDYKTVETITTGIGTHTEHGTWEFTSSKESIIKTVSGSKLVLRILRLTSNEMWLEEIDGGNKYVTHFESFK